MIVDDSAVVRGMVSRWLEDEGDIKIAAIAVDGAQALKKAGEAEIDVCILDIEMPVMSGLEALPKLLALRPGMKVIMASTLSERGAAVTLLALDQGAADYIPKPSTSRLGGADAYRRDLVEKVRILARRSTPAARPAPSLKPMSAAAPPAAPAPAPVSAVPGKRFARPQAMVIASSTGGPPALRQLFAALGDSWRTPILIAQHMPAEFTATLAKMLNQASPLTFKEATAGEPVKAGVVYVAPGDYHLTVRRSAAGQVITHLDQEDPINWCRPSADPLFRTAADIWGAATLGLVLTGMGHDGRDGAKALAAKGARIVAQDEATSVVWGMPGAVVEAGVADSVLPLSEIAPFLSSLA